MQNYNATVFVSYVLIVLQPLKGITLLYRNFPGLEIKEKTPLRSNYTTAYQKQILRPTTNISSTPTNGRSCTITAQICASPLAFTNIC